MTTRHEFLAQLHELIKPKVYLEIGVQHGWSLQLSKAAVSIGVDPDPLMKRSETYYHRIYKMTSDQFFDRENGFIGREDTELGTPKIDLAFIDGMHLADFAFRDFLNIAKYCHSRSVVVFDDVLPTTQEMASRIQCPGDWTGDIWKLFDTIRSETHLVVALVDTTPTGTMVVTGFDENSVEWLEWSAERNFFSSHSFEMPVPAAILDRRHAWNAPAVIENLKDRGFGA